jgi:hypothetical protein
MSTLIVYLTDGEQIWLMRPVRLLEELAELNRQADEVTQGLLYWVDFASWREIRRQRRLQQIRARNMEANE